MSARHTCAARPGTVCRCHQGPSTSARPQGGRGHVGRVVSRGLPFLLLAVWRPFRSPSPARRCGVAGVAARAGARAALVGADATAAARRALPASLRQGARVEESGGGLGAGGDAAPLARPAAGDGRGAGRAGAGRWVRSAAGLRWSWWRRCRPCCWPRWSPCSCWPPVTRWRWPTGPPRRGRWRWPRAARRRRRRGRRCRAGRRIGVAVAVDGGTVTVRLLPPSPLRPLADRLAVTSSASARPAR